MSLPVYQPEKLGARCSGCPLEGQKPVPPAPARGQRHFTLVMEGPGKNEVATGEPAAGATGRFLAMAFKAFGTDRRNVAIHNATACMPKGTTTDGELYEATSRCQPRLNAELADRRPNEVIFAAGDFALFTFTGRSGPGAGISYWRGYPHKPLPMWNDAVQQAIVFPIYHPIYVVHANAYWPIFKMDVERALAYSQGKLPLWTWPRLEVDNNDAALDLMVAMYRNADVEPVTLGFDVETGGTSPFTSPLLCFSLGGRGRLFDGAVSLTYPFVSEGLSTQARALLRHPNVRLELQNANHDLVTAAVNELEITAPTHDLLPDSRVAFPQVDHDLQFTAQVFFFVELWKALYGATGDTKGKEGWTRAFTEPRTARRGRIYNAQDGYMTGITAAPLRRMLRERTLYGEG